MGKARTVREGNALVAVAYLRVSTSDQALSLDAQRAAIEAWASRGGVTIASWNVDCGVSGGLPVADRPALLAALGACGELGAGLLVVAKRDRLAREVIHAATAESMARHAGARIVSACGAALGDGPEAMLMRTLLDAFAQFELATLRARVKKALDVKRARGERCGSVPFARRVGADGKTLEAVPEEVETVERARTLRAGGASLRAIASKLAAEGRYSRNGRPFEATQVARFLAG